MGEEGILEYLIRVRAKGDRILEYLSQRAATPEDLAGSIGMLDGDVWAALDELEARGWIRRGAASSGDDPSSAITVVALTREGRDEAKRRRALSDDEPVILTRQELIDQLCERFGWTNEQIAMRSDLRGGRFWFWPSIGAWDDAPAADDETS